VSSVLKGNLSAVAAEGLAAAVMAAAAAAKAAVAADLIKDINILVTNNFKAPAKEPFFIGLTWRILACSLNGRTHLSSTQNSDCIISTMDIHLEK
jgi:hypothetical protein